MSLTVVGHRTTAIANLKVLADLEKKLAEEL